jgi:ubiquinol-cytochrome c reductase iron-sulfur subunit
VRLWRGLGALVLLALGRGRRYPTPPPEPDPTGRQLGDPRSEVVVAALLIAGGVFGVAFVVLYMTWNDTQLLGLALGLGLACVAAALVVAGKRMVPQEIAQEERPPLVYPEQERAAARDLAAGAEGVTRRKLLVAAGGVAATGLGAAVVAPAASLGPNVSQRIDSTPWRRGRRVVDEQGAPIRADDVTAGGFETGFPEGADPRELGSPIVIVRVAVADLRLPPGRPAAQWAPEGIVAYSKLCTHAGCAVALYRKPTYPPVQPRPALVCPCHYSTFDPARGAKRLFGPAGRPLPQLPLAIDPATRELRANGGFSGSVGPAWWSVAR